MSIADKLSPAQTAEPALVPRWVIGWFFLPTIPAIFWVLLLGLGSLGLVTPGIGDTDQAMLKITEGMTRVEVRAALGRPHEIHPNSLSYRHVRGDYWFYWEGWPSTGSLLHVHFGPDGLVDERYCSIP